MKKIFRTTGELLVKSFREILIPLAKGIWYYGVVLSLVLVVGGLASLPLVVWGAWSLWGIYTSLVRIVIVAVAILVLWIYAHFWTATVMWFSRDADPEWAKVLVFFWFVEAVIWLLCVWIS